MKKLLGIVVLCLLLSGCISDYSWCGTCIPVNTYLNNGFKIIKETSRWDRVSIQNTTTYTLKHPTQGVVMCVIYHSDARTKCWHP